MSQSDVFQRLKSTTDIWAKKVKLPHPTVRGKSYGGGKDLDLDIRSSLTFAAASYRDTQEQDKHYSAFLLSFSMGFTPAENRPVGLYYIAVRALQNPDTPLKDIESQSTPYLDVDDVMSYQWKPAIDVTGMIMDAINGTTSSVGTIITDAIWKSTSPDTVDNTTSYTNSISFSLGANVGFFGKEKTGGTSFDYSMSHSESVNVAQVRIRNSSDSHMMCYGFQPQSKLAQESSFQPAFSGILLVPDDETGERGSQIGKGFRELAIEVKVIVAPLDQRVTTQHARGGHGGIVFGKDTYSRAYHTFTHVLKLNYPPVVCVGHQRTACSFVTEVTAENGGCKRLQCNSP